jgi:Rrf2 family protein
MQLLSIEGDYGLRAVIFLSCQKRNKISAVSEIAHDQMIPIQFLFKILRKLVKKGILKSFRGPNGGYALAKKPAEITFLEVIEAIDGPLTVNRCLNEMTRCMLERSCKMFGAWQRIQTHITGELNNLTIADLLAPAQQSPRKLAR